MQVVEPAPVEVPQTRTKAAELAPVGVLQMKTRFPGSVPVEVSQTRTQAAELAPVGVLQTRMPIAQLAYVEPWVVRLALVGTAQILCFHHP